MLNNGDGGCIDETVIYNDFASETAVDDEDEDEEEDIELEEPTVGAVTNDQELLSSSSRVRFQASTREQVRRRDRLPDTSCLFCCGPGRKRYVIALLCTIGLTVVIGMRSEMLGIITNLKNSSSSDHSKLIFKPSQHRKMPWKSPIMEDLVENAVFFSYLIASPVGGYLTVGHDSSLILGCSVAMTCGINLFLPLVETLGNNPLPKIAMIIVMRLLQGMAEGCLIPAVFGVLRFWCPENEKSTILCLSVIGVSLGPLIGLPVCAEIERKWGWGVVFYIYANIGLIWCIFWWRLVDETPDRDRGLSKQERRYLYRSSGPLMRTATDIPWRAIFTSRPVYAIFCTYAADDWTFQISSVCMQTYYLQMYEVKVERTIYLLSFPFLARSIFVPIGGFLADFLKMKTSWSWTTVRKCLAGLGFGLKGVFFIALSFAKDELYATVLLSLSLGFSGLAVAGYAVNVIDLAPNYCGLVMGFANSISTFTGVLSTVIASMIVSKINQGWRAALCMAAGIQLFSMQIYIIFASSERQSWGLDQPGRHCDDDDKDDDEEGQQAAPHSSQAPPITKSRPVTSSRSCSSFRPSAKVIPSPFVELNHMNQQHHLQHQHQHHNNYQDYERVGLDVGYDEDYDKDYEEEQYNDSPATTPVIVAPQTAEDRISFLNRPRRAH